MPIRKGVVAQVLTGDTVVLSEGGMELRYSNVWAPVLGSPLGDAIKDYNAILVLGKEVTYMPNGHVHWDGRGVIADVYVDGLWVNQELRRWLSSRVNRPEWVEGIPGADVAKAD